MDDKYGSRFHLRKITRINGKIGKLIKRIQEKDIVQCSSFVVRNIKLPKYRFIFNTGIRYLSVLNFQYRY